jgi:DNA-binding GntR family transcriptional regulator
MPGETPTEVDPRAPTPLYRQLADLIAADIACGKLAAHQLVPSEAYLMQRHGLSRGTVRAAVRLLRKRGLVYTIDARGTFVDQQPER